MTFKWIETAKQLPEQGNYLVAFKGEGGVRHYLLLYRTDIASCRNTWVGADGHAFETPDYWARIPSLAPVPVVREDGETILPAKPEPSSFERHLEEASRTVAAWPEWKRRVVGSLCRGDEC